LSKHSINLLTPQPTSLGLLKTKTGELELSKVYLL